jgi:hypothetical protein
VACKAYDGVRDRGVIELKRVGTILQRRQLRVDESHPHARVHGAGGGPLRDEGVVHRELLLVPGLAVRSLARSEVIVRGHDVDAPEHLDHGEAVKEERPADVTVTAATSVSSTTVTLESNRAYHAFELRLA